MWKSLPLMHRKMRQTEILVHIERRVIKETFFHGTLTHILNIFML